MKHLILICCLLAGCLDLMALVEEIPGKTIFRQNKADVYSDGAFNNLASKLKEYQAQNPFGIKKVVINAYASPEGGKVWNDKLAFRRAENIKIWLKKHAQVPDSLIHIEDYGVSWDKLEQYVSLDDSVPARARVLEIITEVPEETRVNGVLKDSRLQQLQNVKNGQAYLYLFAKYFGRLRYGEVQIYFEEDGEYKRNVVSENSLGVYVDSVVVLSKEIPDSNASSEIALADSSALMIPVKTDSCQCEDLVSGVLDELESDSVVFYGVIGGPEPKNIIIRGVMRDIDSYDDAIDMKEKVKKADSIATEPVQYESRPLFALKTNLLYDLAITPNIEIEVPIGNRWSLNGEFLHGWWLRKNDTFCWQIESLGLEARYWLGDRSNRRVLNGWFIGAFGGVGVYDFQLQRDYGSQGDCVTVGLSAGYSRQLDRNWNMEFSLGAGYLHDSHVFYRVIEHRLIRQRKETINAFLPLKAKVSLGYLITYKTKKK